MAIMLGNHTLGKEQEQGTLRLILSRGIFRDQLLDSKILGNAVVMASITLISCFIKGLKIVLFSNLFYPIFEVIMREK